MMQERRRFRKLVVPRQIVCYLALDCGCPGALSYFGQKIGGYDHATVLHGHKTIKNLLFYDKDLRMAVDTIKINLQKIKERKNYMTSLEIEFKIPGGQRMFESIYPAEMLNQIRTTGNDAMFLEKVLNIFSELDYEGLKLEPFQKAVLAPNMIKLFELTGLNVRAIAADFLDWTIETQSENGIDTSDSLALFDEFVKYKNLKNG
jgi:hypothetical protein